MTHNHSPIAYTYDADYHCPECAGKRFGPAGEPTIIPEGAIDSEGNPVGVVSPWDEWWEPTLPECQTLACSDCGTIIDESHVGFDGEWSFAGDAYDVCLYDTDNPLVVRDTGGSIPRTLREWVDTMISDADPGSARRDRRGRRR